MPRQKKTQKVYCLEHDFLLSPLHSKLYYKQNISASFCGGKIVQEQKKRTNRVPISLNGSNCLACPIFNRDKNPATETFILPYEKDDYLQNHDQACRQNEYKLMNYRATLDEKTNMMVPKPKNRSSFCSVCKQNYEDYLTHIKSDGHKNNIKKSTFTGYILELQEKYKNNRIYEQQIGSERKMRKKVTNEAIEVTTITIQDLENEIQCVMPRKKVKQEQVVNRPIVEENNRNTQNMYAANFNNQMASLLNPFAMMGQPNFNQYMGMGMPYQMLPFCLPPELIQIPKFEKVPHNFWDHQVNQNILNNLFMQQRNHNLIPPLNENIRIQHNPTIDNYNQNPMFMGNNFSPGAYNDFNFIGQNMMSQYGAQEKALQRVNLSKKI